MTRKGVAMRRTNETTNDGKPIETGNVETRKSTSKLKWAPNVEKSNKNDWYSWVAEPRNMLTILESNVPSSYHVQQYTAHKSSYWPEYNLEQFGDTFLNYKQLINERT